MGSNGRWVNEVQGFGDFDPEEIERVVNVVGRSAQAITDWSMDHPYLSNTIGIAAAVVLLGGIGVLVNSWHKRREMRQRIGETMPKGVVATEDDRDTAVASDAIYETIFGLCAEKKLSWKKGDAILAKIAHALSSKSLTVPKVHPKAVRRRIEKNIEGTRAGPIKPIPGSEKPSSTPATTLKFLRQ